MIMDSGDLLDKYKLGFWKWNKYKKTTLYFSFFSKSSSPRKPKPKTPISSNTLVGVHKPQVSKISFGDIDLTDKTIFSKFFQRKLRFADAPVVILQDIKDVVLYSIKSTELTLEMIDYLHTPTIDRFFRALIVYFQFYFQVWQKLMMRRRITRYHVWHPQVISVENQIRDDLADLRSMVSKEYAALLLGLKQANKFHHMPDKSYPLSFSKRDVRLNEILVQVSVKIVWVALSRPSISLIELELGRLTRTNYFNRFLYQRARRISFAITQKESFILRGTGDKFQKRAVAQSALVKEALYGRHDPRMLAIGQKTFPVNDSRILYLEVAYTVPEENLQEYGIKVGILGMHRNEFDSLLKRKRVQLNEAPDVQEAGELKFEMPACDPDSAKTLPRTYPDKPPKFKMSLEHQKMINKQYRMWKNYVRLLNKSLNETKKKK